MTETTASSALPFPLVRGLSRLITPLLLATPLTANHVTALSLISGLAAAGLFARPAPEIMLSGALALVVCYVLDNCDGEVARARNQASVFGRHFDTFSDWIVHAAFFAGLGFGAEKATGQPLWVWCGYAAAAGSTINYFLAIWWGWRDGGAPDDAPGDASRPAGLFQWMIYVFRELTRADFCFIVLALAVFDGVRYLLPFAAVGAQVYWLLQFVRAARGFRA